MRFSDLRVGDFFRAHGATFLKLPKVVAVDLPDANAINAITGQLACFGPTVPIEFACGGELEKGDEEREKADARNIVFDLGSDFCTRRLF